MHSALCLIYTLTHEVCNSEINTRTPEITLSQSPHCWLKLLTTCVYVGDEVGLLISLSQLELELEHQYRTPT